MKIWSSRGSEKLLLIVFSRNRKAVFLQWIGAELWSLGTGGYHGGRSGVGVTLGSPYLCRGPAGSTALLLAAASQRGPPQGPRALPPDLVLPGHQPWHLGHLCLGLHSCKGSQHSPRVRKFTHRFIHSCSWIVFYSCQHSFIHRGKWVHSPAFRVRPIWVTWSQPSCLLWVCFLICKMGVINNTHLMGRYGGKMRCCM